VCSSDLYTWLTGSRESEGEGATEESMVLLPHAAKVRLRNKRRLSVETKKDVGFLMRVSPLELTILDLCSKLDPSEDLRPRGRQGKHAFSASL
jgi:hypothetical protein